MESKKIFVFGNSFFNNNKINISKIKNDYLDLTNSRIKRNQKYNIFTKTIKNQFQVYSQSQAIEQIQKPIKKLEKNINMQSCPNKKPLKQIDLNQNYINLFKNKILNAKAIKSIMNSINYNANIRNNLNKIKEENNKFNYYNKEGKLNDYINKIQKNKTFYAPHPINKNNITKYNNRFNNRFNDCLQVIQINAEKTEGNNKTDLKNKMRLTNNNSWFRKTIIGKVKIQSLPKMKNIRGKIHNDKEKVKTFFHITKNPIKQISSIYGLKKINKGKQKNLFYFEVYSVPGTEKEKLKINQDTYLMIPNVNNTHNAKIFGVFDGHGVNSDKLSQEIRDYFIDFFSDKNKYEKEIIVGGNGILSNDENLEKVYKFMTKEKYKEIYQIFNDINKNLHDKYKDNDFCLKAGSTANIVVVLNDKKTSSLNKIISINLGDSKSLLINEENQVFELNIKHTPNNIEEKKRIEKNGGEISRVDWADYGPLRIFYKNKRYPGLTMTRAFGDFNAEELGVNTIPDIKEYDIYEKKPKIIVLATDGIWQFLSNEQVKNIILPYYEENNIAGGIQKLVSSARKMWETMNPRFIDDITVILLFFK